METAQNFTQCIRCLIQGDHGEFSAKMHKDKTKEQYYGLVMETSPVSLSMKMMEQISNTELSKITTYTMEGILMQFNRLPSSSESNDKILFTRACTAHKDV